MDEGLDICNLHTFPTGLALLSDSNFVDKVRYLTEIVGTEF